MQADAREIWEDYRFELEEILGWDYHVLVIARVLGRGTASGVPINPPLAILVTLPR